jgi:hypothetical protein
MCKQWLAFCLGAAFTSAGMNNFPQLSFYFERKVYRRILGLVCDKEKENWRILTNKEIYAMVKTPQ